MKEFLISSLTEYSDVSLYLKEQAHSKIICFRGDLGAGKTCLVQNFCDLLKCSEKASSPTFSIVNEYRYPEGTIYHFDLYRMNDMEEVFDIGMEDYLYSGEYCLIEWPDVYTDAIEENYLMVDITVLEDNRRKVVISKF